VTSPQQAWAPPKEHALVERARPRWVLGTFAGLGAGLVAAMIYAAISAAMDSEILYLIIGVGVVAGWVIIRIVKVASPVTAVISIAVGAFSVAAAIYLYAASQLWGSLPEALSNIGKTNPGERFSAYFSDPLGYVWAAVGVIAALVTGMGALGGTGTATTGTTAPGAVTGKPAEHVTPITPPESK
jgi:hypothetical protein